MGMISNKNSSSTLFLFLTLMAVFVTFCMIPVEARMHHNKQRRPHNKHLKDKSTKGRDNTPGSVPMPSPAVAPVPTTRIFNVLSFGAKGSGISDDSEALLATWKAACKVSGATLQIPAEFKFLIKPITLQGPCMPHLTLQIDGTLLAPAEVGQWPKSSLFQWLNFKWLNNFTIQGSGTVDGQGSEWWNPSKAYYIQVNSRFWQLNFFLQALKVIQPKQLKSNFALLQKRSKHITDMKPTALRFYASCNVTVRDINILNSPQCHLKFDSSEGIQIDNITISSPESSPNTDGIHLQNAKDVEIQHSNIGCGDDCVSIQTGCSDVHIHHINCGPGHGISVGSLGKDKSVACVSNIMVDNISLQSTLAGVRIKTWQGGIGSVKNVSFSNIQVSDVKYPIIIDQFYCDKGTCKNQTEAVAISGVNYDQITGTYLVQPIHLACSNDAPCIDVDLNDIQLKPSKGYVGSQQALCWNSYGKSQSPLLPSSIDYCLRRSSGMVKRIARSHEHLCLP